MPYWIFLLIFLVIPTGLLVRVVRPRRMEWIALGLMAAAAYAWAVPWDNYMVSIGLWEYSPDHLVGVVLGRVPLEEYLFFGLMVLMGGAWAVWLDRRHRAGKRNWTGLVWLPVVIIVMGFVFSTQPPPPPGSQPWTYLILLLGPAVPVIVLQLLVGRGILASRWTAWAAGVLVPSVYQTAVEVVALQAGIWSLDPAQTVNLYLPGGVPVEELLFFLIANTMIVQGVLLVTSPELQARWNAWLQRRKTRRRITHPPG